MLRINLNNNNVFEPTEKLITIHYVIISFSVGLKKIIIQIDFNNKNINTYQRSIRAKEKSF